MGLTYRAKIVLAFVFSALACLILPSRAEDKAGWDPGLHTLNGQMSALQSLTIRHPGIMSANLTFRRNPIDTVQPVHGLLKQLGEAGHSPIIAPTLRFGASFSAVDWKYDENALEKFRKNLVTELATLDLQDLSSLEEAVNHYRGNSKQLRRLVLLSPFLFDADGNPKFKQLNEQTRTTLNETFKNLRPNEISAKYQSDFDAHYKELLLTIARKPGQGALTNIVNTFINTFIKKDVADAIQPLSSANNKERASVRSITLEQIPPVLTPFRGDRANDCSKLSVPYYGLIKETQVYWIHKNSHGTGEPDGYVFVAEVIHEGKKTPYIITINGATLSHADVRSTLELIARKYDGRRIIVPNLEDREGGQPHLVNTEEVRKGMQFKNAVPITVSMPEGWNTVEEYINKNGIGYENYYIAKNLVKAFVVDIPPDNVQNFQRNDFEPHLSYEKPQSFLRQRLTDRALLSAYSNDSHKIPRQRISKILQVSSQEINAAIPIIKASLTQPITVEQFEKARDLIGFKFSDLMNLDILTRSVVISALYKNKPSLTDEKEWKKLCEKTDSELTRQLVTERDTESIKIIYNARLELPFRTKKLIEDIHKILFNENPKSKLYQHIKNTIPVDFPLPPQSWKEIETILKEEKMSEEDMTVITDVLEKQSTWPQEIRDLIFNKFLDSTNPNAVSKVYLMRTMKNLKEVPENVWNKLNELLFYSDSDLSKDVRENALNAIALKDWPDLFWSITVPKIIEYWDQNLIISFLIYLDEKHLQLTESQFRSLEPLLNKSKTSGYSGIILHILSEQKTIPHWVWKALENNLETYREVFLTRDDIPQEYQALFQNLFFKDELGKTLQALKNVKHLRPGTWDFIFEAANKNNAMAVSLIYDRADVPQRFVKDVARIYATDEISPSELKMPLSEEFFIEFPKHIKETKYTPKHIDKTLNRLLEPRDWSKEFWEKGVPEYLAKPITHLPFARWLKTQVSIPTEFIQKLPGYLENETTSMGAIDILEELEFWTPEVWLTIDKIRPTISEKDRRNSLDLVLLIRIENILNGTIELSEQERIAAISVLEKIYDRGAYFHEHKYLLDTKTFHARNKRMLAETLFVLGSQNKEMKLRLYPAPHLGEAAIDPSLIERRRAVLGLQSTEACIEDWLTGL